MAINIYKEKNLGADNTKNEKYFILIFGFFTRKIGIENQEKPVSKGFSYFEKGTLLLVL